MSRDMLVEATAMAPGRDDSLSRVPVPALAPLIAAAFATGQPLFAALIGILRWDQCFCGGAEEGWSLGLTAVLWYTAVSVPAGVLIARRLIGRTGRIRATEFVSGIVPAALGALVATPVVAALARSAVVPGVDHPGVVAGFGVPIGAAIGVFAACAALASVAVVRGLVASWLWVWFVGLIAAMLLKVAHAVDAQPLGAVDITVGGGLLNALGAIGLLIAVIAPMAVAAYVAYRSVRLGSGVVAATIGGAAGTLLIAATYQIRGDELFGGADGWYALATVELLLSVGAAVVAALVSARMHPARASSL